MKHEIEWNTPKEKHPPFGKQILVALGGQGSDDCTQTWVKYVRLANVVIDKTSPNDDEPGSEYSDYKREALSGVSYDAFQFYVVDYDKYRFENDGDIESDWFSDAIVAWAPMPDFSEVLE